MFESIFIHPRSDVSDSSGLNVGHLFESMLFYGSTKIFLHNQQLPELLRVVPVSALLELVSDGFLELYYSNAQPMVYSRNIDGTDFHNPTTATIPKLDFEITVRNVCAQMSVPRILQNKLKSAIHLVDHSQHVIEPSKDSILDDTFLNSAAKAILTTLIPRLDTSQMEFAAEKGNEGIVFLSNVNYDELNALYHQIVSPKHSAIRPAWLLAHIVAAQEDLYCACNYVSEISTSPVMSALLCEKVNYLIQRRTQSAQSIHHFQSITLDSAKGFTDAVNDGRISIDEAITILKKAAKFKQWLQSLHCTADIMAEFNKKISEDTLLDKLPFRIARFVLFTGIGFAVHPVMGVGIGAFDAFVVDKMLRGWKPNQFINNALLPAIDNAL